MPLHRPIVFVVGVLLLTSCGAPTPSSSESLVPVSQIATPTARASQEGGWVYPEVSAPAAATRRVALGSGFLEHRADADGPYVVLDVSAVSTRYRGITLVDLAAESLTMLYVPPRGWTAWFPAISDGHVAWIDWQCATETCMGPLTWRLMVSGLTPGTQRSLASGTNAPVPGGPAQQPLVDVDRGELAYTKAEPHPGQPFSSEIQVVDWTTGGALRALQTDSYVYQLAIWKGNVAYVEGAYDTTGGFVHHTHLMLWRAGTSEPVEVAKDAFEMSFAEGRLAWIRDKDASQLPAGNPLSPQVFTTGLDVIAPLAVGLDPGSRSRETTEEWPATADGQVVWGSEQVNPLDPAAAVGDRLAIWNASTGRVTQLGLPHGVSFPRIDATWLVWLDARPDLLAIEGIPLAAVGQ